MKNINWTLVAGVLLVLGFFVATVLFDLDWSIPKNP